MKLLKNEKEALQMFCEEKGKAFDRPFINALDNGRLLASDRKVMILVNPAMLQEAYETRSQRLPNFDMTENADINIAFSDIDKAYSNFKLIPEKISKDGQSKDCPECDGSGTVEYCYDAENGQTYYKEDDCPICNGTGTRKNYELIETGRMILPDLSFYQLNGVYFAAPLFGRIIEALRLMGFESMTLKISSPTNGNKFIVCEGIELWLMPCANINLKESQIVPLPLTPNPDY